MRNKKAKQLRKMVRLAAPDLALKGYTIKKTTKLMYVPSKIVNEDGTNNIEQVPSIRQTLMLSSSCQRFHYKELKKVM
jgi:hypothetical protein